MCVTIMLLHSADPGGGETKLKKSVMLLKTDKQKHARATANKLGPTTVSDKVHGTAGANKGNGVEVIGLGAQHGLDAALHHMNHGREPPHPQHQLGRLGD